MKRLLLSALFLSIILPVNGQMLNRQDFVNTAWVATITDNTSAPASAPTVATLTGTVTNTVTLSSAGVLTLSYTDSSSNTISNISVSIPAGTTSTAVIANLLNASPVFSRNMVADTNGGALRLRSKAYGNKVSFTVTGNNTATSLGFGAGNRTASGTGTVVTVSADVKSPFGTKVPQAVKVTAFNAATGNALSPTAFIQGKDVVSGYGTASATVVASKFGTVSFDVATTAGSSTTAYFTLSSTNGLPIVDALSTNRKAISIRE